jgi:hypothetical protein
MLVVFELPFQGENTENQSFPQGDALGFNKLSLRDAMKKKAFGGKMQKICILLSVSY